MVIKTLSNKIGQIFDLTTEIEKRKCYIYNNKEIKNVS